MKFNEYQEHIKSIKLGKHLPKAIYIHLDALNMLPTEIRALIRDTCHHLKIDLSKWDLIKLFKNDYKFTLLSYPDFFDYAYPALNTSLSIDLTTSKVRKSDYSKSTNPPILHRKELFLPPDHPKNALFTSITKEGEAIGLYTNTRTIGFKENWERQIKKKGYYLDDTGRLQPITEKPEKVASTDHEGDIQRHKTALSRDKLSLPLFLIAQKGYLDGRFSILDYGCGRGDDLRELKAHGVNCHGWDPAHDPDTTISSADIVNLGYVINVIEDKEERIDTLKKAYGYADKAFIVSAMLGNDKIYERFKAYKDGVITSKNTFQKYYVQGELKYYIETTLDEQAIALGPGIFVVFKDKIEEQNFLLERQRTRYQWRQLTRPEKKISKKKAKDIFSRHQQLFEDYWYTCLDLGRMPANDEFEQSDHIRHMAGSHIKALTICEHHFERSDFEVARQKRIEDLLVYFALGFFGRRPTYSRMPESLQRDIKEFFGKYSDARDLGKELLFSVADIRTIYDTCVKAHEILPASVLNEDHDLVFHKKFINLCPATLRVYIGCATQLYGELDEVDLIKAHIKSGKVSLMVHKGFNDTPIPLLIERIKIKLREQDIDFFDYVDEFKPQPLFFKSLYIDNSFTDYRKQKNLDQKLKTLNFEPERPYSTNLLSSFLKHNGLMLQGYLVKKL